MDWIPRAERRPAEGECVLIAHDTNGHVGEARYTEGFFVDVRDPTFVATVPPTHWAPLPPPPSRMAQIQRLTRDSPHYPAAVALASRFAELRPALETFTRQVADLQAQIAQATAERESLWAALVLLGVPEGQRPELERYVKLTEEPWVEFVLAPTLDDLRRDSMPVVDIEDAVK